MGSTILRNNVIRQNNSNSRKTLMMFLVFLFLATALTSCGGGGSDGKKKISPNMECSDGDTYCNSDYAELKIKTTDNRIWLTISGEYKTLQATPQGRPRSGIEFENISSKNIESWTSSNISVATVDQDGLITAVSIGEAIITYELEISDGIMQPATKRVIVKENSTNMPPEAVIDLSQLSVDGDQIVSIENSTITARGGAIVRLSNNGSSDSDGEITSSLWDVPPALVSSEKNENDIIINIPSSNDEQIHSVTLEVQDDSGATSSSQITLRVLPVLPIANILGTSVNVIEETEISFSGELSSFNGINGIAAGLSYKWEQTSEINNYPLLIENPGAESFIIQAPKLLDGHPENGVSIGIKLTVTNELGFSDNRIFDILIQPQGANIAPTVTLKFDTETVTQETPSSIPSANEKTIVCATALATDNDPGVVSITWTLPEGFLISDGDCSDNSSSEGDCDVNIPKPIETLESSLCFTLPSQINVSKTYTIQAITKDGHEDTEKQQTTVAELSLKVDPVNLAPIIETSIEELEIDNKIRLNITVYDPDPVKSNLDDSDGAITKLNIYSPDVAYTWAPGLNLDKNRVVTYVEFEKPILKQDDEYTFDISIEDNEGKETTYTKNIPVDNTPLTPSEISINLSDHDDREWELSWTESEYNTQYIVYWRSDNFLYNQYSTDKAFKVDENLMTLRAFFENTPGTTYYYKVKAVYPGYEIDNIMELSNLEDNQGNSMSDFSVEAVFLPQPQNLYISDDKKKIQLKWDAVSGADKYRIECVMTDSNGAEQLCTVNCNENIGNDTVNGTTCTHEQGIVANALDEKTLTIKSTQYDYRVIPISANTESVGRYTDKNEVYARVGEVADISPAPDSQSLFFKSAENIYYLSMQIGGHSSGQLGRLDPNTRRWHTIQIPSLNVSNATVYLSSFVNESSGLIYIYEENADGDKKYKKLNLSNPEEGWKDAPGYDIHALNCSSSIYCTVYKNYVFQLQGGNLAVIDLQTGSIFKEYEFVDDKGVQYSFSNFTRANNTLFAVIDSAVVSANLDQWLSNPDDISWADWGIVTEIPSHLSVVASNYKIVSNGSDLLYYRGYSDNGMPLITAYDLSAGEWLGILIKNEDNFKRDWDTSREGLFFKNNTLFVLGGMTQKELFSTTSYEFITNLNEEPSDWVWHFRSPPFSSRAYHKSVVYQGNIYQIGGGTPIEAGVGVFVESYDPFTGGWTGKSSLTYERNGVLSTLEGMDALVYDGEIKVFGGGDPVESLNYSEWVADNNLELLSHRDKSCTVTYGDEIFVFGGDLHSENLYEEKTPALTIEYFSKNNGEWQELGNLPSSRANHGCVVYEDEVYLIGGFESTSLEAKAITHVDVFNLESKVWRTLSTNIPELPSKNNNVYSSPQPILINDAIVFIHPMHYEQDNLSLHATEIYSLNVKTEKLELLAPFEELGHSAFWGMSMAQHKGAVYLFGGYFGYSFTNRVSVIY